MRVGFARSWLAAFLLGGVSLLSGCFPRGEWIPTIWGGEAIDDAADPDGANAFSTDDCEVTLDAFVVTVLNGALLTPEGTASAVLPGDQLFDLSQPGPHSMAAVLMRRGPYPELAVIVGPADEEVTTDSLIGRGQLIGADNAASDSNPARGNATSEDRALMEAAGAAALARGTVTCGADTADFELLIDDGLGLLRCPMGEFEVPGGSFGVSEVIARAERVLADPSAIAAADDELVTMESLTEADADDLRRALRGAWEADGGACEWESGE